MQKKRSQHLVIEGDHYFEDYVGEGSEDPTIFEGVFGDYAGAESVNPIFKGTFGKYTGYRSKNPIFEEGKFRRGAGDESENAVFIGGEYSGGTGMCSVNPIFKGGRFRGSVGVGSENAVFIGGEYSDFVGLGSEGAVFKGGTFGDDTCIDSIYPVFKGGVFGDSTGLSSDGVMVIGGSFGRYTLDSAENVKAYISEAKSIGIPRSGYIIARNVSEVESELILISRTDCVFYFTDEEVAKSVRRFLDNNKLGGEVFYIEMSALEEILEKADFNHFKEIEDYETLSLAMDYLICRVDEASKEVKSE